MRTLPITILSAVFIGLAIASCQSSTETYRGAPQEFVTSRTVEKWTQLGAVFFTLFTG